MESSPEHNHFSAEAESALYVEVLEAERAARAVMAEIDAVLMSLGRDRVIAEQEVLEHLVPKYEAANRRFVHALSRWQQSLKKL